MKDNSDKKRPDGEIGGSDLPDRGVSTGVTDTYGADLESGDSGRSKIGGDTKSDDWNRNVPMGGNKC